MIYLKGLSHLSLDDNLAPTILDGNGPQILLIPQLYGEGAITLNPIQELSLP